MISSSDEATSGRIETRSLEHRRPRSLFIALGIAAVFAVVLGRWADVTSQLPHVAIGRTQTPVELDMEPASLPAATSTPLRPTTSASTELDVATVSLPVTTAPTLPSTTSTSTPPPLPPLSSAGCAKHADFQGARPSELPLVSGGERRSYLRTTPSGNEPTPRRSSSYSMTEVAILPHSSIAPAGTRSPSSDTSSSWRRAGRELKTTPISPRTRSSTPPDDLRRLGAGVRRWLLCRCDVGESDRLRAPRTRSRIGRRGGAAPT
jgi:hypothetical protein